ncbi:MAG: hypothetical protein FLDDKLPJ_01074 [Phycisphaerae bacterium]|nr:hypothetical protein [Phycisphaerae bacterium]
MNPLRRRNPLKARPGVRTSGRARLALAAGVLVVGIAAAAVVPTTLRDFHLPGTQVGDVSPDVMQSPRSCAECHAFYDRDVEPYSTWSGSLMAHAGRDPLFYAQMTLANQDVGEVGYFCLRCHVPMSMVTGHALDADGSTLDAVDREGVSCHFCHSLVDPVYRPGISPAQDKAVLAALAEVPAHYGNAMFVLDPSGTRRGPREDADSGHPVVPSPFHRSADLCGTCHDVGNVTLERRSDGTFKFNEIDFPVSDTDPTHHFPLERTYTEWKLSAFAAGGVDMGGRFGGDRGGVVSTCQDCHMPRTTGQACFFGPTREDLARHTFAGASAWVLEIIADHYADDPDVDEDALREGRERAVDMLRRAATLEPRQEGGTLVARVINESGHKLPTGHIEGRRVFLQVRVFDAAGSLLREYGAYDADHAELDEASTVVYEMHVGLSDRMSELTGYPAGETTHMALADLIVKDSRIPPRGFTRVAFAAAGAPVVAHEYADGQHWDDAPYWLPQRAAYAEIHLYYQTVTRHYIEALRDGNTTDHWGETLHRLWRRSGKGPPILMAAGRIELSEFLRGDADGDGDLDLDDYARFAGCLGRTVAREEECRTFDFDGDGRADLRDFAALSNVLTHP